jgi:hypothetical protein
MACALLAAPVLEEPDASVAEQLRGLTSRRPKFLDAERGPVNAFAARFHWQF